MNQPLMAQQPTPDTNRIAGRCPRARSAWVLCLCAALASCAPAQTGPGTAVRGAPTATATATATQQTNRDELAASRAGMDAALSLQCSIHSDCATLPIGARACGGPEGYLAYSKTHSDVAGLKRHLSRYNQLRKAAVEASGEMSTCQLPVDPGAQCTAAGQCQLMPTRNNRGLPAI